MPGTNNVSLRRARSRQRQAQAYARPQFKSALATADIKGRRHLITLPLGYFYDGEAGTLILADKIVRVREGMPTPEALHG